MIKVTTNFLEERAAKRERALLRWAQQQLHVGPALADGTHRARRFEFAPLHDAGLHFQLIQNRMH